MIEKTVSVLKPCCLTCAAAAFSAEASVVVPFARPKRRGYMHAVWDHGIFLEEAFLPHLNMLASRLGRDVWRCGNAVNDEWWSWEYGPVHEEAMRAEWKKCHSGIFAVRAKLAAAGRSDLVADIDKRFGDVHKNDVCAETSAVMPLSHLKPTNDTQAACEKINPVGAVVYHLKNFVAT